jgi:hypothetical protein
MVSVKRGSSLIRRFPAPSLRSSKEASYGTAPGRRARIPEGLSGATAAGGFLARSTACFGTGGSFTIGGMSYSTDVLYLP